ncbi:hypothetical protein ON010_g10833 [Phytophthora cinnamomi]|nr:hypothetical protein ON010_g10833 [Phytophthora cinnamomi]
MPADRDATEPPRVYAVGDFSWMEDERYGGKKSLWTRVKEDPLVPLGCAATTAVLLGGLMTFQRGQSKLGNKFMQARVVVQTATVLALAGGAALAAGEKQEKRKQNYEDRMQIKLREDKCPSGHERVPARQMLVGAAAAERAGQAAGLQGRGVSQDGGRAARAHLLLHVGGAGLAHPAVAAQRALQSAAAAQGQEGDGSPQGRAPADCPHRAVSPRAAHRPSVDPAEQVLSSFLVTLETAVMTPAGLLLPRQRATLRVYAQLCRVFRKREQLVTYATTVLQQSPVLAENAVDAKGKKVAPPGPAHFGAVAGACHALRFHTVQDEQVFAVDKLVQLAFTMPSGTASRHAAKTLVSLLTSSSINDDRPSNAVKTAKAIELFLLKARPRTLLGGDSLTSVYLLRLCGQMYRLPVHQQQQQQPLVTNGSDPNPDSTLLDKSSGTSPQSTDQNPALQGFFVSNALSAQLQDYLTDVVQGAATDGSALKCMVAPAVLLVAIEELLRGTSPEASVRKQSNWGSACIFELVAAALLSLLPTPAKPVPDTITLHRVCRAVQFVAERLDTIVLQLSASSGLAVVIPNYLSNLTMRMRSLTEHRNAFVACEALRAYAWLLPRSSISTEQNGTNQDDWANLFWQLEVLPFNRIQPERRAAIAWTLFRRCVTTPKSYGYAVETPLLAGCLRIVLAWFRMRPCVWQAALLTALWRTALGECLAPLGDAVFLSITELLDFQCSPTDSAAQDSLVVKQSAMQFLSHREGGMRYVVRNEAWSYPLILRLTKQALLETGTSQRLSTRALSQLRDEAHLQGFSALSQQVMSTLGFLQRTARQSTLNGDDTNMQTFSLQDEPLPDDGAVAAVDDDPFSDFRAPDEAASTTEVNALDDPFADAIRSNSATASDFTSWNDTDETFKAEPTSMSDFKVSANSSLHADSWGEIDAADKQGKTTSTKTDPFETTGTTGFSSWPDGSTTTQQNQVSSTTDNFFGNFSVADGTESSFASWGDGNPSQTTFDIDSLPCLPT